MNRLTLGFAVLAALSAQPALAQQPSSPPPGGPPHQRPQLTPEQQKQMNALHQQFEQLCHDVTAAVNQAAPGRIITDSEEKVRNLLARFRQRTYQAAVQLRLDAAQAAFPPSESPADRQTPQEPGA